LAPGKKFTVLKKKSNSSRVDEHRKEAGWESAVFRFFFGFFFGTAALGLIFGSSGARASYNFRVYSVYHPLDLGETQLAPEKEYYISMGQAQGLKRGDFLEISRRLPTYDLRQQQFYRDLVIPIAWVEVIYVDVHTSVAHLKKMLPAPQVGVQAVMVGDEVRRVESGS
jgi:hypothetical protein